MTTAWTWLGHRDWCPLQWKEWPCDCPCSKPTCPGIDRCQDPECPVLDLFNTTD